jgi:H+-transporting ATPase
VTAVMIVMLALLNDGAILSIAYDNVHYKDKPEAWNMRMVLGISTVLGIIGVVAAFGLFFLGERVFHLDRPHIQTLMYLKLSVAGHLTIFLTRTRGPLWSIRPAKILWVAVLGTQIIATLIAVYGLFMTPIGWSWAGFVWGYALVWFLVNDRVKLLAYRILDSTKAESKPEVKVESHPEANAEPKAEDNAEPKPEVKTATQRQPEAKSEPQSEGKVKAPSDLTPQIAKRAYELNEERTRKGGSAVQDWEQAERELRKETIDPPKTDHPAGVKAEPNPENKIEPMPVAKAIPITEDKTKVPSDLTPQLVKRVHELYEELGRKDLQAVEALEKAERDNRNDEDKAEPGPIAKVEPQPTSKNEPTPEGKVNPLSKDKIEH